MNHDNPLRQSALAGLRLAGYALLPVMLLAFNIAGAENAPRSQLPEMVVIGSADQKETVDITPGVGVVPTPDSMDIIGRLPGAAVNTNGMLSGQAQYRGLFGPRLNVLVDGMKVTPGGLNWMDSPMHYMPPGLTKQVALTRGIASVSSGPGIGGLIRAESRKAEFTSDHDFSPQGDVVASGLTNDGWATSGVVGLANVNHRMQLIGSVEDGDDYESGDGTVGATEYGRTTVGGGYGYRWGYNDVSLDYSYTDTDLTGTPALPLDIEFFRTHRINFGSNLQFGGANVAARVFYTDVDHAMNNYQLREPQDISMWPTPPPPEPPFLQGTERRDVAVDMQALGFALKSTFEIGRGELGVGVDGNFEEHSGIVTDPDAPPFYVENFENATQDNLGLFAEYFQQLGEDWFLEIGLRYQRTESSADDVNAQPADLCDSGMAMPGMPPCVVAGLRDSFNNADRDKTDNNVEAVVQLDYTISDNLLVNLGYARKTRAPSYIEYYLWIPLEVNSGLGDFNNYVGNLDLDSETSDQVELGLEWNFSRGNANPRVFYRYVDDYIQGVETMIMPVVGVSRIANGDDDPLQFTNTRAEIYGFDMPARYLISENLILDAMVSYTRGKNTKLNDNLYRIAPLNGRIALTFDRPNWSVTAETVMAAKQTKLSREIVLNEDNSSNEATSGWGIVNLYAQWLSDFGLQVRGGVENVTDREYTLHTAGFNRVTPSDVTVGDRLPGRGINFFANVAYSW